MGRAWQCRSCGNRPEGCPECNQYCDKCRKELPDDLVDCYVMAVCRKHDSQIAWSDKLQLCETCAVELITSIKGMDGRAV